VIAKCRARVTALDVAAESLGAAGCNRGDRARLHGNQAVRCLICRPKAREEFRQFYLGSCRIRMVRMRAHGALTARWAGWLQEIERRVRARQVLLREMEVACGGREIAVAHQALNGVHVGAGFQQVRGKRVAQGMNSAGLGDAGAVLGGVEDAMGGVP
jgi:hypothetical protein